MNFPTCSHCWQPHNPYAVCQSGGPFNPQTDIGKQAEVVRKFSTGATRDSDEGKFDYHRFGSALVEKRFCAYMHKNRIQSDKSLRAPDNWKSGIPKESYLSSLGRHMKDLELHAEGFPTEAREDEEEALCAVIFNARGMLYEILKKKLANTAIPNSPRQYNAPTEPSLKDAAKTGRVLNGSISNTVRCTDNEDRN